MKKLTQIERVRRDLAKWTATYARTKTVGAHEHVQRLTAELAALEPKPDMSAIQKTLNGFFFGR